MYDPFSVNEYDLENPDDTKFPKSNKENSKNSKKQTFDLKKEFNVFVK